MKNKEAILIELLPKDFRSPINFSSNEDCPLCRAAIRHFKRKDIMVGGDCICIDFEYKYVFDKEQEWNPTIMQNVAHCYMQGDKTIYYVPVYPVK